MYGRLSAMARVTVTSGCTFSAAAASSRRHRLAEVGSGVNSGGPAVSPGPHRLYRGLYTSATCLKAGNAANVDEEAAKQAEISELDDQIIALEKRRATLDGSITSYKYKAKMMAKEYGLEFMVYWTAAWAATGVGIFSVLHTGVVDGMQLIHYVDDAFDLSLGSTLDPDLGNIALAIALNELLEPARLPLVILTTPAVVKKVRILYA